MRHLILGVFCLSLATLGLSWTKDGTTYTTDGSQADVTSAIADSTAGDTVNIPAGSFTWGASTSTVSVNKAITLWGAGEGVTTINISSSAPTYGSGTIAITAAAVVGNFSMTQSGAGGATTAIVTSSVDGWRITEVTFNSAATSGYSVYVGNVYGLIDNCIINGGGGSDEFIFTRGPTDSWQTAHSLGTADAVYVEDCTFNVAGYTDFNSNARAVVRFCTITNAIKIDGHGLASNTPPRGVRHVEVYENSWTKTDGYWTAVEMRGGSGILFNNSSVNNLGDSWFTLTDYGVTTASSNFGSQYQTPYDYPVSDQIGVGIDPKSGGSEPMYMWGNTRNGSAWVLTWKAIPQGAIDRYRAQTGDGAATFTMPDVIAADRDYFNGVASFDGSTGVGTGTKAQMTAITPTTTGVGFWVTDEADWNSEVEGNDGQLYVWDGAAWELYYTPYTYPHPLRGSAPAAQVRRSTSRGPRPSALPFLP